VDNNAAALTIEPGPFPPSPPNPPISPPLPPAPPFDASSTRVLARFTVLREITSQEQLEKLLARTSADIEAGIDEFVLNMPIAFKDFSTVDCNNGDAVEAFAQNIADLLQVDPGAVSLSCSYSGSSQARRRNLLALRSLQQVHNAVAVCMLNVLSCSSLLGQFPRHCS
jgi:hypothetical protein